MDGIQVSYGYNGAKRPAADQHMFDELDTISATGEARQKVWMAVSVSPSWQGIKDMVNIRGWYQSAGDGTFYYVNTQTVAGQKIEVLTQGAGAQAWTDTHWFRSLPLAKANASAHFDSDIDRPTD